MSITEKSDDAVVLLTSKLNTLKGMFDVLDAQVQSLSQLTVFPIWAEENGPMATDAYEWSWGNGAVGTDIGVPVAIDCEMFACTLNADVFGTSASMRIERNGIDVATPLFTANNELVTEVTPVLYSAGDRVSFRTGTVTGSFTDGRICAWFRSV